MTLPFTPTFLLYSALGILMLAGILLLAMLVTDWRDRLISNRLIISYAILFPVFLIVAPVQPIIWQHCLCALVVFLFTFFCFTRNWLGGGDAKLIPIVALWLGPQSTLPFLLMMVFGGCAVAVLVLVVAGKKRGEWRKLKLPYGVAIVIAALIMMWVQYGSPSVALLTEGSV